MKVPWLPIFGAIAAVALVKVVGHYFGTSTSPARSRARRSLHVRQTMKHLALPCLLLVSGCQSGPAVDQLPPSGTVQLFDGMRKIGWLSAYDAEVLSVDGEKPRRRYRKADREAGSILLHLGPARIANSAEGQHPGHMDAGGVGTPVYDYGGPGGGIQCRVGGGSAAALSVAGHSRRPGQEDDQRAEPVARAGVRTRARPWLTLDVRRKR